MIILEGRKEDVYNKFKGQIDSERKLRSSVEPVAFYDIIIQEPFIQQTNYKYLEPLVAQHFVWNNVYPRQGEELEKLEPNTVATATNALIGDRNFINSVIPRLEFFERNKDRYPKKDFKQYVGWDFDEEFMDFTNLLMSQKSKKDEREIAKKDSVKIYEDENLLVVKPLTHQSSCYYGAGTKWCTTMAGTPSYFEKYSNEGSLYYIILKKVSRESKYAKIALLLKPDVEFDKGEFYNTKDHLLTDNEIEIFKTFVINKAVDAINKDNETSQKNKWLRTISKEFKNVSNLVGKFRITKTIVDRLGLVFTVNDFDEYSDLGDVGDSDLGDFIRYSMNIKITPIISGKIINDDTLSDNILVDGYINQINKSEFELQGTTESENGSYEFMDSFDFIKSYKITETTDLETIMFIIVNQVLMKISGSKEVEDKSIESLERFGFKQKFGNNYTFQGGGKLTKQMIDYLDNLPENNRGNKLDFLQKYGVITTTKDGNFNKDGQKVTLQGYLSSWFSALNKADIISATQGRKGFTKGQNFEKFKAKILTQK
jgi:hypothetical protein